MQNLLDNLKSLLQKDERLVSEGELLKNKIIELALKLDRDLIKLLLSDEKMKEVFFVDLDGTLIFDKDKFVRFVSNKQFLPDSYTAFKNKIGLIDEKGEFISEKKEVVLSWPYKDCVLEGGMTKEEQKRDEIFWNEILAPDEISRLLDPKVFTNAKRIDAKGEHKFDGFRTDENGDIKDNLIIKGNNLLVLHSLKKRFAGKIKLIYIDPPYNTGNDSFKYNDSFNHSTWLVFMKNRLEVAKELLRDDGFIFCQIDDTEQAYIKVLLDEIFTRENFISIITWQRAPEGRTVLGQGSSFITNSKEMILVYAKNAYKISRGEDDKKRIDATEKVLQQYTLVFKSEGNRKLFKEIKDNSGEIIKIYEHKNYEIVRIPSNETNEERIKHFDKLCRIAAQQEESSLQQKILRELKRNVLYSVEYVPRTGRSKGELKKSFYLDGGIILLLKDYAETDGQRIFRIAPMNDFWSHDEIPITGISQEGNVTLRRGKKPEKLIQRIINLVTNKGETVLDYHLGSGTTCAVAHKMGRQYIGVEQLDYGENSAVVRLKNVINGDQTGISKEVGWKGGGDFLYLELMKWNENFVDKIQKAKTKQELKKLWEAMKEKAFLSYKVDIKTIDVHAKDFDDLSIEDQKRFLLECLDKNHLYVNYSEIDDEEYGVSEEDKKVNREFYGS
jgi:adenine-specific DNA-methyltransferase